MASVYDRVAGDEEGLLSSLGCARLRKEHGEGGEEGRRVWERGLTMIPANTMTRSFHRSSALLPGSHALALSIPALLCALVHSVFRLLYRVCRRRISASMSSAGWWKGE